MSWHLVQEHFLVGLSSSMNVTEKLYGYKTKSDNISVFCWIQYPESREYVFNGVPGPQFFSRGAESELIR